MPAYDHDFDPPAPVAQATVLGADGQARLGVRLLIDSGSDTSVIPRDAAETIGATIAPSGVRLAFYDGTERAAEAAELTVRVAGYRFRGRFVIADAAHGVLGRNILNLLVATLHGPAQTWLLRRA